MWCKCTLPSWGSHQFMPANPDPEGHAARNICTQPNPNRIAETGCYSSSSYHGMAVMELLHSQLPRQIAMTNKHLEISCEILNVRTDVVVQELIQEQLRGRHVSLAGRASAEEPRTVYRIKTRDHQLGTICSGLGLYWHTIKIKSHSPPRNPQIMPRASRNWITT